MSMEKSKSMMDVDDYDEEDEKIEVVGSNDEFPSFSEFEKLITTTENLENNRLAELQKANFIKKGTAIWHMLNSIKTGT